jgi:ribonucleoside-diphosphate reductase alpha chain
MNKEHSILSDIVVWMKYAKFIPELNRRETWEELVTRNMNMHIAKFPEMEEMIKHNYKFVYEKKVLPSMRSLQFGGKPIEVNNTRLFNCSYLHIDDYRAFSETMFLLLSGTGVGYSVQKHHVENLPPLKRATKNRRYLIGDSIEGLADAVKVLVKSYFGLSTWKPAFDYRAIRSKGERLITSGGVAPGPEPLKICLNMIESIFERKADGQKLTPLECHDILCHIATAVLAGGIRRSAMISLFDKDDEEMLTCKFGKWYETNPQRGRANNSAVLLRGNVCPTDETISKEEFLSLWKKVEMSNSGEPGFYFSDNKELGTNPCCEISLNSFQFCNLVEINASDIKDQQDLMERTVAAAFIGTLQASYTDFHYLRPQWKKVTEKEALLGIGMTGIASGRVLQLDLDIAAKEAIDANRLFAKVIGINSAARVTCVKPSGTASLVLGTSSGVHAWHDEYYMRRIRIGKNEAIYTYLSLYHPDMIEEDQLTSAQVVLSVPVAAPEGAITRSSESAIDFLERVKFLHGAWIKPGHIVGDNTHNVSATVTVKNNEWKEVGEWLWNNQDYYNGLSFLPEDLGSYPQTPFETITKHQYEEAITSCHLLDVTKVIELSDNTSLNDQQACGGGGCEI